MDTKIFTVIPNWNGADMIGACLESLLKQSQSHTVVVVDNGSVDDSLSLIQKRFKQVVILKNETNLGFAGGVNVGIRYALSQNADFVALANNDAIFEPAWLKHLVTAAHAHPEVGIITGKFLRLDKITLDSTGDQYSVWGVPFARGRDEIDSGQYDQPEYLSAATGGASLYRAALLQDIGLFDERFFAYYEDVDISFRAQLAGWKIWYQPTARAYHKIGGTSSKYPDFAIYHQYKNFVYLATKNLPTRLLFMHGWKIAGVFIFKIVGLLARFKFRLGFRLFLELSVNIFGALGDRRTIQSGAKIDATEFNKLLYRLPPPSQPGLKKFVERFYKS